MPPGKDPYRILGLQPGASDSEIKKAYHDASLKNHPDHNKHPDATERMQEINYAHELLSDPKKRKQYDQKNRKPDRDQGKRKQYDQTNRKKDRDQGYCASCSEGECTHEFNFKPARPIPKQVCHWCKDGNSLFQTGLCPQHLWCSRCLILRYTLACSDARCCEQMVRHAEVRWHLPEPVAALYDFKQACNYEPLRQPMQYDDLSRAVRDWQEVNPSMAYGLAASYALTEKDKEINRLQGQLADCDNTNKELRKQLDDLRLDFERKEKQFVRERDTRNQNKSSAAADRDKLAEKDEEIRALQADLADCFNNKDRFKPGDHNSFSRKQLGSKLSDLQWRHDNTQKESTRNFEEKLKRANAAAKSVPAQSESNLKDELVRKNMRIAELERSTKIAKDTNARNIQASSEAQKARKAAVDNEAVVRKENERLTAELAAALSELERLRQDSARTSTSTREQSVPAAGEDTATRKRNKDLETELTKLQQDLQDQRQALTNRDANLVKCQAELSGARSARKMAIQNDAATQKRCEALETELAKVKVDLQTQQQALAEMEAKYQAELSAAQADMKTATDKEDVHEAAQQKVPEQSGPPFPSTPSKASPPSSAKNTSSPRAPLTPTPAPRDAARSLTAAVASAASNPLPTTPSKSPLVTTNAPVNVPASDTAKDTLSDVGPTEHQASQKGATKFQTKPFDLAAWQRNRAAGEPSFSFDFSKTNKPVNHEGTKPDNTSKPVLPAKRTEDKTVPQPPSQTEQPESINIIPQPTGQTKQPTSRAPKTDDRPKTSTSLLEGQLHYAKATQKAAQEDARRATEEILQLRAELKRYKQFEFDVYHEIARANEMYRSLERKLANAKKRPRQREERSEGAVKIPADQFAHPVDDNDKSTTELLARLNENFAPMQAEIKNSQAARKKIEQEEESSLRISARTNRRLRDTIRQKDLEIEDMRINYGQRWASLLDDVCTKESEIRRLKKKLHIRESRSGSQASIGAVDPHPLGEKDMESVTAKESETRRPKNPLHARCSSEESMDDRDPPPSSAKRMDGKAAKESTIKHLNKTLHTRCSSESSIDAPNPPPSCVTPKYLKVRRLKETLRTPKLSSSSGASIDAVDPPLSREIDKNLENYWRNRRERGIRYQKMEADLAKFVAWYYKEIRRPRYVRKVKTTAARPQLNGDTILHKNDGRNIGALQGIIITASTPLYALRVLFTSHSLILANSRRLGPCDFVQPTSRRLTYRCIDHGPGSQRLVVDRQAEVIMMSPAWF
ncbi:hypothetical protein KCU71_g108, partial [Aureobasidium melanogenum]